MSLGKKKGKEMLWIKIKNKINLKIWTIKGMFKNYFLFFNLKTDFKTSFEKYDKTGLCFLLVFKNRCKQLLFVF